MSFSFNIAQDLRCNLIGTIMDAKDVWVLKLSKHGTLPTLRNPVSIVNSMGHPMVAYVKVPLHPDYVVGILVDAAPDAYFRNTYFVTGTIVSTEARDPKGQCKILCESIPAESFFILFKIVGEENRLPIYKAEDLRLNLLSKIGLLMCVIPNVIEDEATRHLTN